MIRKFSLAKGMFSTKISLAKGIRSKNGAAQPHQKKNFGVLSHLISIVCDSIVVGKIVGGVGGEGIYRN